MARHAATMGRSRPRAWTVPGPHPVANSDACRHRAGAMSRRHRSRRTAPGGLVRAPLRIRAFAAAGAPGDIQVRVAGPQDTVEPVGDHSPRIGRRAPDEQPRGNGSARPAPAPPVPLPATPAIEPSPDPTHAARGGILWSGPRTADRPNAAAGQTPDRYAPERRSQREKLRCRPPGRRSSGTPTRHNTPVSRNPRSRPSRPT